MPKKKLRKRLRKPVKIMLMRHAEKPTRDSGPYGVTFNGKRSKESLQIRGWQRAGALTHLLAPADGHLQATALAKPHLLYASKPLRRRGSRRPMETITPLAEKLALKINTNYARSDVESMIDEVFRRKGVVLICWQREYIPDIASYILDHDEIAPANWPEDRFDMIWVFDLDRSATKYRFKQVPQKLLKGDSATPIR